MKGSLKSDFSTLALLSPLLLAVAVPSEASAAVYTDVSNAIPSAFAAYGHYLGLVLVSASLTAERLLIKPGMNEDEENKLVIADSVYGLASLLVVITGYLRVTQFGKGWDFYSHEPVFWVKLLLFVVMGSSSYFPTIKIVQRAIQKRDAEDGKGEPVPPMSEKLANRMVKIVNGELLAVGSIPLAASLMSRGVGYADSFPWEAGVAVTAAAILGLGYKYGKEALTWSEE